MEPAPAPPTTSHALASQVGGHPGVRASDDNKHILKPCLPAERAFYETVVQAHDPGFQLLAKYIPAFYGAIILENLSQPFTQPNILDVKLGTVLYDESASQEKKERMIKAAKETTSLQTGVRITGFQVYDTTTQRAINTPKDYGRALKAAQLPEAAARFFPIKTPILALSAQSPVEEGGTKTEITPSPAGLPPALLLPVLRGVLSAVKEINLAVEQTEIRMVAASVLVIYEGDPDVLKRALEDDSAGPPPYTAKLIDFAHTKVQKGLGRDEGVLLGLSTTISMLEGRIKEVEEVLGSVESVAS